MKQIFSPQLSLKWKVVNNLSIVFTAIKLLIPPLQGNLTLAISTALTAITPFQKSFIGKGLLKVGFGHLEKFPT
jgi:hypothetical protein